MNNSAAKYLLNASVILKENISFVFTAVFLSFGIYLSNYVSASFQFLFVMTNMLAIIIIIPLFFGQFIEILINGQRDTWSDIFNKYWLKIFVASMILKSPTFIFIFFGSEMQVPKEIASFIINTFTIYVLPLVLIRVKYSGPL